MMKRTIIILTCILHSYLLQAQAPAVHINTVGQAGPTIIFLPGFTTPGSVWDQTIDQLMVNYQAVKVSYAGFNGLEPIPMPWYGTIKDELVQYIKSNNLATFIVVGHSMGGNLAVELAAQFPDKVNKMILVDALPCMREIMMPGVSSDQIHYQSPYNKRMLDMSDEAFKETVTMMAKNMTVNPDHVAMLAQWSLDADRETYVYGYTDLLKLDLRETLKSIKAETLIIGAPFPNTEVVQNTIEEQYAQLAHKQIEIAQDSRHFIMLDQPQWFYEKVNAFLGK